jgi:alkanesulfonate monooxygenase SsuD/methylene tetrahydromethanopterin reductase-like flavin-dependent oxidoreductase (luciferase family)
VLRLLWAGGDDGVSFAGEFFTFDNLCSFPKPYGVTHLPIHIGGSSRAAARRAGRRGDGYFPGGALSPHERALQMDLARSTAVDVGRDPRPGTPPTPQRSSTGAPNALVAAGRIGEDTAAALKAEARRCITAGQYFGHIAYASLVARLLN